MGILPRRLCGGGSPRSCTPRWAFPSSSSGSPTSAHCSLRQRHENKQTFFIFPYPWFNLHLKSFCLHICLAFYPSRFLSYLCSNKVVDIWRKIQNFFFILVKVLYNFFVVGLDVHVRVRPRLLLRLQAGQEEEGNNIFISPGLSFSINRSYNIFSSAIFN